MDNNLYLDIYNKIKEYDTIILHRHQKPDGDALGSQMGLKEAILATFPTKDVKLVGDMLERYNWMGKMDEINDELYTNALVIVLDSGAEKLISDERYSKGAFLIKIDHHIAQGEYGNIMLVDTSFESCAGLVTDFIIQMNMKQTSIGATSLFTGIVTDSGRFRFSSTTSRTFKLVSYLMEYNINTEYIYTNLYQEKLANVKLKAQLTMKFKVTEKGVAYLINTKEEIQETGLTIFDISRGMIGIMGGIENIPIWVNFSEDTTGVIFVEIRSSGININQIAAKHGGGGHLQASGCSVNSFDEVKTIIKELDDLI